MKTIQCAVACVLLAIPLHAGAVNIYPFGNPPTPFPFPTSHPSVWNVWTNGLGLKGTDFAVSGIGMAPTTGVPARLLGTPQGTPNPTQEWVFSFQNKDGFPWTDFHINLAGAALGCTMTSSMLVLDVPEMTDGHGVPRGGSIAMLDGAGQNSLSCAISAQSIVYSPSSP